MRPGRRGTRRQPESLGSSFPGFPAQHLPWLPARLTHGSVPTALGGITSLPSSAQVKPQGGN